MRLNRRGKFTAVVSIAVAIAIAVLRRFGCTTDIDHVSHGGITLCTDVIIDAEVVPKCLQHMTLCRVVILVLVKIAEVDRRYDSTFAHLLESGELSALCINIVTPLNVFPLVNTAVGADEQD